MGARLPAPGGGAGEAHALGARGGRAHRPTRVGVGVCATARAAGAAAATGAVTAAGAAAAEAGTEAVRLAGAVRGIHVRVGGLRAAGVSPPLACGRRRGRCGCEGHIASVVSRGAGGSEGHTLTVE